MSLSVRLANVFNVVFTAFVTGLVVGVVPLLLLLLFVVLFVLLLLARAICAEIDDGGVIPRFFNLSRRTSMTATSTMISGLDLSMSPMIFSVNAIWSGVPRTMSAHCEFTGVTFCNSRT